MGNPIKMNQSIKMSQSKPTRTHTKEKTNKRDTHTQTRNKPHQACFGALSLQVVKDVPKHPEASGRIKRNSNTGKKVAPIMEIGLPLARYNFSGVQIHQFVVLATSTCRFTFQALVQPFWLVSRQQQNREYVSYFDACAYCPIHLTGRNSLQ